MKHPIRNALLLAAALCAQLAAHAGELTLYSHENFRGREVTLREVTPDLTSLGFNDRAASMVVRSGRWELCVDAGFRGQCAVFEPGDYPSLDRRFNRELSSAREVAMPPGPGQWPRGEHGPRGMVELFAQPGLRGNSVRIMRDSDDFVRLGFNDRTASVSIEEGVWEFCRDAYYRGGCRVLGPGRYPDLGPMLSGQVSSARLVQGNGGPGHPGPDMPPPGRPGPGMPIPGRPAPEPDVVLFQDYGLHGRAIELRGDAPDFVPLNFNDQAASMLIRNGEWEFCVDSYFRGRCRVFGPGEYRRLDRELDRAISSARRVR